MISEGNALRNGEPTVGTILRQWASTQVGFGQGFLSKNQRDNTGAASILSWRGWSWFLPVTSTEILIEMTVLLWCYWHHSGCDGRAEKAFTRWLPGMFPIPVQSLTEVDSCKRGLFWKKRGWSNCAVLYCSEIKWFRELTWSNCWI